MLMRILLHPRAQDHNTQFKHYRKQRKDYRQWRPYDVEIHTRCVVKTSGRSLEIMYNVMQRPVGHERRAYSTGMLR